MTSPQRTTPRFSRVVLATALALAATAASAPTAGADKPTRGCTASYAEISRDELRAMFPNRSNFAEVFAKIDKNDDGVLCAKQTPGLFNTVDNTSNSQSQAGPNRR